MSLSRRFALVTALALFACSTTRSTRVAENDAPIVPGTARLTIVGRDFREGLREARIGVFVRIADANGNVVGDVGPGESLRVTVMPGEQTLFVWHDEYGGAPRVAAFCATLEDGQSVTVAAGPAFSERTFGTTIPKWSAVNSSAASGRSRTLEATEIGRREVESTFRERIETVVKRGNAEVAEGRCFRL